MKMSALMAENSNSLSHFVDIVYSCFLIMYCIVSYCVLCLYLICYLYTKFKHQPINQLYTNVSTKVYTRNKDIYSQKIFKHNGEKNTSSTLPKTN